MSYFISPYRFDGGDPEGQLGWAVFLSAAFHLLAAGLIIYVLPTLLTSKDKPEIIKDIWVVDLPGDPRTSTFDEPLIDPRQVSRDEGRLTNNTDQPKPPPSVQAEPLVTVEEYIVPLGDLDDKQRNNNREPVRIAARPGISTPVVAPEPASAIMRGEGVGGGGGTGGSDGPQKLHPEMAGYYGLIRSIISRNWTTPNDTFSRDIVAVYAVTIEPDGRMSQVKLMTSSGNESYDASVLTAINLSKHLPELPPIFQGQTIRAGLMFRLSDLLQAKPRVQAPAPGDLPDDDLVQAREVF